jgi:hypothetical protein
MRKVKILLLFLVISSGCLAQQYQILDSISDYDGIQMTFIYDENGKNTAKIYHEWDGESMSFKAFKREEFAYNSSGNPISIMYLTFNIYENTWQKTSKVEWTYDEHKNIVQSFDYSWSDTSWVLTRRVDHENVYSDDRLSTVAYHAYTNQGYNSYSCSFDYDYDVCKIDYRDGSDSDKRRIYEITHLYA